MCPKEAETRTLMKIMDNSMTILSHLSRLLKIKVGAKIFTDSRLLLESLEDLATLRRKLLGSPLPC